MARLSTCKSCGKKLQPEEKYTHAQKHIVKSVMRKLKENLLNINS